MAQAPALVSSFRDGPEDQTSDAQSRIRESRDSGFDASHRPGMTSSSFVLHATSDSGGTLAITQQLRPPFLAA